MTERDAHVPRWLRASRGDWSQERLAEDITRVTGWKLTRDRYSKYESGSLSIGPKVKGHFVDYWASRGVAGPEVVLSMAGSGGATTAPDLAALIEGIADLVRQVEAERAERRRWELGWIATLRAALEGQVPAELLDALVPPPPGELRA